MKEIPLSQGLTAQVDDEDFEWLSQWKWHAWRSKPTENWYAVRSESFPKKTTYYMHRDILGLKQGDRRIVDHVESSQSLNNQRKNLRLANPCQSSCNARKKANSAMPFKGVYVAPRKGGTIAYGARIRVEGKRLYLGYRSTAEEAYALYCEAAKQYHGEFARVY